MALQRSEFGLVWSNWFDFHHLVLISWRCGFNVYCACQVQLRSHAALRPYTASPESAENYSTTCQFYCVVITQSHQQTVRIPCLLCWCGGVNLRSGEMSSSSFSQFNTLLCAFIAGAGNCLSLQSVVAARLLCMLCCRGSSVDASWAAATASWFEVKPWRCSLVSGVALSARTFSSPCLYRPLFRLSPYSCVVVPPQLFLPVDFEGTCRWGTRRHRAVLIEPSLCLVTAVCRGTETWEGIQAALESPTGSITWELNKTETYRVPRLGSLLSLVSRTSTRD